ncbi:hypothetical protein FCK90_08940 [Kocuria coralli]|uniref:Uncharacterized protein n=1 Tax=Kocuria coralli TaxID=1461025 RepID=A0A5J5KX14_9MICC|nr:hypothetical protein [Kocuria coralli]KAA9394032.1 hypothetical protein FCK90_08940 [Kocuria coralli]
MQYKSQKIRESEALMELFTGAPNEEVVTEYVDFFAASSTREQVDKFAEKTEGKRFVVPEGVEIGDSVELVDRDSVDGDAGSYSCCQCWKAITAAAAYFAASEMICIPAGVISGGVAGVVYNGIFFAAGMLPNFDDACD